MVAPGCASSGSTASGDPGSSGGCGSPAGSCAGGTIGIPNGGASGGIAAPAGGHTGTGGNGGTELAAGTSAGGASGTGGAGTGGSGAGGRNCAGPVGKLSGELATGIVFLDTEGERVNAHGGGIIKEGDTYYLHGELFLSTATDNNFYGFSMYSSQDLATWKNEGIILPTQPNGELGPKRKGERPHIIRCPATGEYVLYAHAASEDY